jgi:hypothetical protein
MKETTLTKSQMAALYRISRKTFVKRLKLIGVEIKGYLIFPKQQQEIFEKLGEPPSIKSEK